MEFNLVLVRIRFQKENNGMSVFVRDNPKIVYEQVEMPNKYAQKLYLMATEKFDRQENKAARYTIRKCQHNEPYKSFIKVLTDPNTTLYRDSITGIVESSTGEKYIVDPLSLRCIHDGQDKRFHVPVEIGQYLNGMFNKIYDSRKDVPDTPELIAQHLKMLKEYYR